MIEGGAGITAAGNLRHARFSDVCGWVKRAWEKIPDEMIIQSFKTCNISTSLDGSDDEISSEKEDDIISEEKELDSDEEIDGEKVNDINFATIIFDFKRAT